MKLHIFSAFDYLNLETQIQPFPTSQPPSAVNLKRFNICSIRFITHILVVFKLDMGFL